MTQSEIAILIVTFNSANEIAACLESTRRTSADVLVIDNASSDDTAAIARRLGFRVLANDRNLGFAAAVNLGVYATTAPYLLLLNPDAILLTGIEPLMYRCSGAKVGACGGLLLNNDGTSQQGWNVRRFPTPLTLAFEALGVNRLVPSNSVNWRYRCLGQDLSQAAVVDQPAGAFFLFRRDVWQRIGPWDEGFFPVWFEDVDFCKRIYNGGSRIMYEPSAAAKHLGGHAVSRIESGRRSQYWYRSLLRYAIMHFGFGGRILTASGVAIGSVCRFLLTWKSFGSYCTIVGLAFRSIGIAKLKRGEPFA